MSLGMPTDLLTVHGQLALKITLIDLFIVHIKSLAIKYTSVLCIHVCELICVADTHTHGRTPHLIP